MSGFSGLQIDPAVLRAARRGERQAHAVLFNTFSAAVYSLTLRLSQSAAVADDLLQETFIEVMRSLPGFRGDASVATWIRRIAVSKCLMHLRSAWERKATGLGDDLDTMLTDDRPELGPDAGQQLDLEAALGSLSATARAVVWLHDVEGYTHREISELMGRSESFSKSQLSRAHALLRQYLAEPPGGRTDESSDDAPGEAARCAGRRNDASRAAPSRREMLPCRI
jgi:RNA polymerase sigma-70 factor (ECF subfamily)